MRHLGLTLAAVLAAGLAACSRSENTSTANAPATAAPTAEAPTLSEDEKKALLAAYPAPYNTADLANGETKFALCRSCHTITPGGANMTGPNLHGVFGREAAAVEGYRYSDALKGAGLTWDGATLDQWLAKPATFLPGTKMSFAGVKDAKDRADLIAYLMVETGYKPK